MVGGAVRCPAEVDSTQLKQVFRDRASQCAAAAAARYRKALKAPIPPGVRGWSSARLRAPSATMTRSRRCGTSCANGLEFVCAQPDDQALAGRHRSGDQARTAGPRSGPIGELMVVGSTGCTSSGSQGLLIWFPSNFTRRNLPFAPATVPSLPSHNTRLPRSRSSPCSRQISLMVIFLAHGVVVSKLFSDDREASSSGIRPLV